MMALYKKGENKAERDWRIILLVSTALIFLILLFFIVKLFSGNPMKGVWVGRDNGLILEVKSKGRAVVRWADEETQEPLSLEMKYSQDKKQKTFRLQEKNGISQPEKSGRRADFLEESERMADRLQGVYAYSIDKKRLTLTDMEYGGRLIFERE